MTFDDLNSVLTPFLVLAPLVAAPFVGQGVLRHLGRLRPVRPSDVLVEGVLIGATVAAIAAWLVGLTDEFGGSASTAALVGVDAGLLAVTCRGLAVGASRRGPLGVVAAALAGALISHVVVLGWGPTGTGSSLRALGAVFLVGAALYVQIARPVVAAVPPTALFSRSHAAIVATAIVTGPLVLAFPLAIGSQVSSMVIIGEVLVAVALAAHVVDVLLDRARGELGATHDPLTGLPNRVLFADRLERAIAHAQRVDAPVGVIYIDLDRFKDVNDALGHRMGDYLLQVAAQRLGFSSRAEDTVARLGGDEFALLLPHLAKAEDVLIVADRVLEALREPIAVDGHRIRCSGSIGVATYPEDGTTPHELLAAADDAMYRAKDQGGTAVSVYDSGQFGSASTRLAIETELYRALDHDELVLFYQPIVEAADGTTAGAEALVRWNHPEHGLLGPADFVPVAEQSELISHIGAWVIREACRELVRWRAAGYPDRYVAVNVSARQFHHDLVSVVTSALRDTGADARRLVVELTETAAVEDLDVVAARLRELRTLGVRAVIDDFGTGFCGLQYLSDLPVSALKLDRSFIQSMNPSAAAIVGATVAMGKGLGLKVVAEGIETPEQRRLLIQQGCDRLQGFLIGRPMPADELLERFGSECEVMTPNATPVTVDDLRAVVADR